MKLKLIGIVGFAFIAVCAGRIAQTYQVDRQEAIFESFLLAAIAGYHGAALRTLSQQENHQQAEQS